MNPRWLLKHQSLKIGDVLGAGKTVMVVVTGLAH
jgi:hypothetical protein